MQPTLKFDEHEHCVVSEARFSLRNKDVNHVGGELFGGG